MDEKKDHVSDRIYGEYQAYRADILGLSNTGIFEKCYEIDTIVNIYEILTEKIQDMSEDTLNELLSQKNILMWFYDSWLSKDDINYRELESHIEDEIKVIVNNHNKKSKGE
jgi:hypothetical protein